MKIVIMEDLGIPQAELDALKKNFEKQGHTFAEYPRTSDKASMVKQAADADAVIIANMPMPGEVISACEKLKFIDVAFTGVDHVGLDAAKAKEVAVSNASGYSNEAVAELGICMALSLLRNVSKVEERCRQGGTRDGLVGTELKGKTVGIVGLGRIGKRTAELYHAFGCKILANSRTHHTDWPDYIEQVSLEVLLKKSDIVQLHCPLNDSTRNLINRETLAKMKPTAYLINLARGPVVDTADLADALNGGLIAGAGIDVFEQEPPLGSGEPLLGAKNTILTPHVAFASRESMSLRAQIVFDNLAAWMKGEQKNVILSKGNS